jgi:hypothetical protein
LVLPEQRFPPPPSQAAIPAETGGSPLVDFRMPGVPGAQLARAFAFPDAVGFQPPGSVPSSSALFALSLEFWKENWHPLRTGAAAAIKPWQKPPAPGPDGGTCAVPPEDK